MPSASSCPLASALSLSRRGKPLHNPFYLHVLTSIIANIPADMELVERVVPTRPRVMKMNARSMVFAFFIVFYHIIPPFLPQSDPPRLAGGAQGVWGGADGEGECSEFEHR